MVTIRGFKVNYKFFFWLAIFYFPLLLLSFVQWNSTSEISRLWYLFVFPVFSVFFYVVVAFHHHILNRGWFFSIPFLIVTFLCQLFYFSNYLLTQHHVENEIITIDFYLEGINTVFPFFLMGILFGGSLGFLASLLITNPDRPPYHEIKEKSIEADQQPNIAKN